jgi:hypothetical protein
MNKQIDHLLIAMVKGLVPSVPSVAQNTIVFFDTLQRDSDPRESISRFLFLAEPAVQVAMEDFQNGFNDNAGELANIANVARLVLNWIYQIKQALLKSDQFEVINSAIHPMGWLETLIKTLKYKTLTRQALA